jgi:hypothetical protein
MNRLAVLLRSYSYSKRAGQPAFIEIDTLACQVPSAANSDDKSESLDVSN